MKTIEDIVREFHVAFHRHVGDKPEFPDAAERSLRVALLYEEYGEQDEGENNNDIVEVADGIGDMIYILVGTAISYGIPIMAVLEEIHASNMSKMGEDGLPILRADGKILKGPNYFKPDIKKVLGII